MRKKVISVRGMPDFRKESGEWVRSYVITTDVITQYHTRAGGLWGHLTNRCNPKTAYVKNKPTYKECSPAFEGFQAFTSWCQDEFGYLHKEENGNYWSLDKDILVPGNKVYGPDTCMFVPNEVNLVFGWLSSRKGDLPVGVNIHRGRYRAYGADRETNHKHLGYFTDPLEAHKVWQEHKIAVLREYAAVESYGEKISKALLARADLIQNQLNNNIETIN